MVTPIVNSTTNSLTPTGPTATKSSPVADNSRLEVIEQPDISATPQTVMNIIPGVDPQFQNGPTDEERKKYEAYSQRKKKAESPIKRNAPGVGNGIYFNDTGTMKVN